MSIYEGKSLNNGNFILNAWKSMHNEKSYFGTQNGSLATCRVMRRDDRAVWACTIAHTVWPLHCQLAPWKSEEVLFIFCGQRVWNLLKSTEERRFSMKTAVWLSLVWSYERTYARGHKFADDDEVMEAVRSWLEATPKNFFFYRASASLWTGGLSVLRSGGTVSKNKTQTISISTLVKKVL
jgi:hypothetical protein